MLASINIETHLCSPTRRAIPDRLGNGEKSVADLAAPFAPSQPTISTHLKIVESGGLVARARKANLWPVRLQPAGLAAIEGWIGSCRALWDQQPDKMETLAAELQQKDTLK